jgi:hypothetical protein
LISPIYTGDSPSPGAKFHTKIHTTAGRFIQVLFRMVEQPAILPTRASRKPNPDRATRIFKRLPGIPNAAFARVRGEGLLRRKTNG